MSFSYTINQQKAGRFIKYHGEWCARAYRKIGTIRVKNFNEKIIQFIASTEGMRQAVIGYAGTDPNGWPCLILKFAPGRGGVREGHFWMLTQKETTKKKRRKVSK